MTWRIEPQKIESLLSFFCHYIKFRVRVSVGIRVRGRVGFRVRIMFGISVIVSLVCNND